MLLFGAFEIQGPGVHGMCYYRLFLLPFFEKSDFIDIGGCCKLEVQ